MLILFVLIALGIALAINVVISILSGEHPQDTGRVWLDIVLGEFSGFAGALSRVLPRWLRWALVLLVVVLLLGTMLPGCGSGIEKF